MRGTNNRVEDLMLYGPNGFKCLMNLDKTGSTVAEMEEKARQYQAYQESMMDKKRKDGTTV